jgi:hypothetical protein
MPKPVPDAPARYRAFLSALRRTANAEFAFRQSWVNRSWAYWRRQRDADFARIGAVALAMGQEFHRQIGPLQRNFEANSRDFRDLCYARRINQIWWAFARGLRSGNNSRRKDKPHRTRAETNVFTTRSTRVDQSAMQIAVPSIEVAP